MNSIAGFGSLANEVKFGHITEEQAQQRIAEYVRQEVEWKIAAFIDLEIGLHPVPLVQYWADRVKADPGQTSAGLVARLLGEYAMLRRRMEDARIQVAAARLTKPQLPPALMVAEAQLFAALRELRQAQEIEPAPPPDRRQSDRRDK
jgi:hypothetical protein